MGRAWPWRREGRRRRGRRGASPAGAEARGWTPRRRGRGRRRRRPEAWRRDWRGPGVGGRRGWEWRGSSDVCSRVDSGTLTSDRNQSGELWNTETRVHCVADASVFQCRSKCFSVTNLFIFRSNVTNLFCSIENLYREQVQIRWEFFFMFIPPYLCLKMRIKLTTCTTF